MNRNKRMLKTTIIYFVGNFGSKILTFLLLPIYTNWLSPDQFGNMDLLLSIVPLIGPIFTLQTTESIFRFLFDCKSEDDVKKNVTSAFTIYCFGMILFLVLFIPYCMITHFEYSFLFGLYFILNYLGIFFQQVMRGFKQNIDYSATGVISTLVQGVTNILLIRIIAENSLLVAPILASLCIVIYGLFRTSLFKYLDFTKLEKPVIKEQLNYSVPLIPNQICWWFNGIVGKYIVNFFLNTGANGILAVATRFPNLVSTIMQIYFLAWTENSIYEFDSEDRDEYFSNNLKGLMEFMLFCMAGLLVVIKIYFKYAIDPMYYEGVYLVPILFIAMFFNCIATFFGTVYTASKKTKDAFFTTVYAAIVNIVASYLLIGNIGIMGYALANLLSYLVLVVVRIISVRKIVSVTIRIPNFLSIISFVLSIVIYFIYNNTIILLVYGLIVFLMFVINYRTILRKLINKIQSK